MEAISEGSIHSEGHVEFDIGFPSTLPGNIRIRGTFPRIKPRTERPGLTEQELQSLVSKLVNWLEAYFDLSKRREDLQNLAKACVVFAAYVDPWSPLESDVMDLEIQLMFWCTLLDDIIEQSPPTAVKMIREQNDHFQRLWRQDDSGNERPQQVYDMFVPLCDSLAHIRDRMRLFPAFTEGFPAFLYFRRKYDRASELVCSLRSIEFLNLDMFKYWRNIVLFMDGSAVTYAILHDIVPGKASLESPYMSRLFDVANSYGSLANDILGVKRDVQTKEQNFILFHLNCNRNQPDLQKELNLCVEQMCQKIKEDVVEYIDLRARLLNSYPSDSKLEKFLELFDSCIDGHLQLYLHSSRYSLTPTDSINLKRSESS